VKQPNSLLKLATVVSSVLLAGGFVAYRVGAFNSLMGTSASPADSESSPTSTVGDESTGEHPAPTILPGSKSFVISSPTLVQDDTPADAKPPATTKPVRIIMSGSKSIFIPSPNAPDTRPPATSQQPPPGTTKPARRTIMGGTKSAEMIVPSQTLPPGGIQ
jgi:hypothetical protein